MQQAFDAAQALFDKQRFAEADAAFGAIETRLLAGSHHNARTLAVARLRRAQSLLRVGDTARATALLIDALPGFATAADSDLRAEALLELGEAEERALDLTAASVHYRAALALTPASDPGQQIALRMRAGRTALFDDPTAIAGELAAGLPQAQSTLAKNRAVLAQYVALYGRALLNAGQTKPARAVLDRALTLSGGLTDTVDLFSLDVRGDAALAAQLSGDTERAVELTAYTGAGGNDRAVLPRAPDAQPPACGGASDLRPDDLAVVQFTAGDDGTVIAATPIYASRSGPMAVEFARSVREWSWPVDVIAKVAPFFRIAARVELRCTTRAERRSSYDLLWPRVKPWLATVGRDVPLEDPDAKPDPAVSLSQLEARLHQAEATAGVSAPALVPLFVAVAARPATGRVASYNAWTHADQIARSASAPAVVIAWIGIHRSIEYRNETRLLLDAGRARRNMIFEKLASDPVIASDPIAHAAVLVAQADSFDARGGSTSSARVLGEVMNIPVSSLPEGDPIRQAAAIRLASVQAGAGDRVAAEATFRTSGLAAEQCGLIDADPKAIARPISSADYPEYALRRGLVGWAVTEFDVLANGRTRAPRTVIAYPAFLFGSASTRAVRNWTFRPSFRPDGVPSCGGYQTTVRYQNP